MHQGSMPGVAIVAFGMLAIAIVAVYAMCIT